MPDPLGTVWLGKFLGALDFFLQSFGKLWKDDNPYLAAIVQVAQRMQPKILIMQRKQGSKFTIGLVSK